MAINRESITIAGAGPAGLAAAITAELQGIHAVVHERRDSVGRRFHGDFQGLENWTTGKDVMVELADMGIDESFKHTPFYETVIFDPDGRENVCRSPQPLFYLIKRGQDTDSLDAGLEKQAVALGADIHFNSQCRTLPEGGIAAQGPHRADVIAVGYLFDTNAADGAYVALSDSLAPQGYAYLLIHAGRGTLATCMFNDFHDDADCLARTVAFFREKTGVTIRNERRFGGSGNFAIAGSAMKNNILHVGECAGFQDAFAGFGLRYAMQSGHLAAVALARAKPRQYDVEWRSRFRGMMRASIVNRYFYAMLGDAGYRRFINMVTGNRDARHWMRGHYAPGFWKTILYPVARYKYNTRLKGMCVEPGCHCAWCRCHHVPE